MTVRVHRDAGVGWTKLPNELLRDPRLTLRARGLLVQLLSHEDGWVNSLRYIEAQCADGRTVVAGAFAELEAAGYATRSRSQDAGGRFRGWDYDVYDSPRQVAPSTVIGSTVIGDTDVGHPAPKEDLVLEEDQLPKKNPLEAEAPTALDERRTDPVFEFLYLVETGRPYETGTPMAANLRARLNAARVQARQAGFSEVDLERAVAGWAGAMGDARITANALVTNAVRCLSAIEGATFAVPRQAVEAAIRNADAPRRQAEQERLEAWMDGRDA